MTDEYSPVLFYDGDCNLCNRAISFITKHDRKKIFHFFHLQSEEGKKVAGQLQYQNKEELMSIILFDNNRYYTKSTAVLHIFRLLGGWYKLLYAGIIIPVSFRDKLYQWVARNRYKWFGSESACTIPHNVH